MVIFFLLFLSQSSKYVSIVYGLLPYIEQVSRSDLELPLLTSLIKHDLHSTPTGSKLSIIVVEFLVSRTKPAKWHKTKIAELMGIVERHPKGNFIRFGMLFMTLNLVKIKEMTSRYTPHPNLFKLFEEVNWFIKGLMCKFGSRSCFGTYKKHEGMSSSLKS